MQLKLFKNRSKGLHSREIAAADPVMSEHQIALKDLEWSASASFCWHIFHIYNRTQWMIVRKCERKKYRRYKQLVNIYAIYTTYEETSLLYLFVFLHKYINGTKKRWLIHCRGSNLHVWQSSWFSSLRNVLIQSKAVHIFYKRTVNCCSEKHRRWRRTKKKGR